MKKRPDKINIVVNGKIKMQSSKSKVITLRVDEGLYELMRISADKNYMPVSVMIRYVMAKFTTGEKIDLLP